MCMLQASASLSPPSLLLHFLIMSFGIFKKQAPIDPILQTHFILPVYLMQKDQRLNIDGAKDRLKQAGLTEDEMAALERQLAPAANKTAARDSSRSVRFVSAGVQSHSGRGM